MKYEVGQPIHYQGKKWHILALDREKQTVELCDSLLAHGSYLSRCVHVQVTMETLTNRQLTNSMAAMFEQITQQAAKISENFRTTGLHINYLGVDAVDQVAIDHRYSHNKCYGFSVLYCRPSLDSDEFIQYAVEVCSNLPACWDMVDYLVDAEEGQPLAIRHDLKVIYYCDEGRWLRNYDEYPDVPADRTEAY